MRKCSLLIISNCKDCPHCQEERTRRAGMAIDYLCSLVKDPKADYGLKVIKGYVESQREAPQDNQIPDWCPLPSGELDE